MLPLSAGFETTSEIGKEQSRRSFVAAEHVQSKRLVTVSGKVRSHLSTPTCLERRWFRQMRAMDPKGVEKIRNEYRICTFVRRKISLFVTDVTVCKSRESHPYPFRTDSLLTSKLCID